MHATCKSARGNHETAFKVMPTFQWNYMDYLLALRVHRVGTLRSGTSFSVSRYTFTHFLTAGSFQNNSK